ncbi:arginase [Pseudaestuariivita rosea]|uniref:arginase n=1 Tax=Pseudaestuariivita rosea TaxID=2763263 RepID=UPI001ABAC01F|nr:arginase [Pseudaestuariivita rosea]
MAGKTCKILGAPVQAGTDVDGCLMGPDAFRTAGLKVALQALGHDVSDLGNVTPTAVNAAMHHNPKVHGLSDIAAWIEALQKIAYQTAQNCDVPIFLGGDHSISAGTVPGIARYSNDLDRPQFVFWMDAHPDLHTLDTTASGNLHGTPVAYFSGEDGFDDFYPPLLATVPPENIFMLGLRSVDPAEHDRILNGSIQVHDMREVDEQGVQAPLEAFLKRVADAGGALHVSFDVDVLDPGIAPGVGTAVPGGLTYREAHHIMEILCDSGLVTSIDLVELNPFLDDRGKTATLMVDLCASLMGRKVFDRSRGDR